MAQADNPNDDYDYASAGFDPFMSRSIDDAGGQAQATTLDEQTGSSNEMNYDSMQQSGSMGNTLQLGKIKLDGDNGRISTFDDDGNEVVRIGKLDD